MMEWGNPRLRQRTLAKRRTIRYAFPQRTDERSLRSFIGLCVTRPVFARAIDLPKVTNFFFVLFLFGKEKGHLQTSFKEKPNIPKGKQKRRNV